MLSGLPLPGPHLGFRGLSIRISKAPQVTSQLRNTGLYCFVVQYQVMSDSLQPHGLQHIRPPCPSPSPPWEFAQTHVHCISDAVQCSHPLTPSSPALNLSQHQGLCQ